ncbi:MAG: hypothetical protein RL329_752 [Bacteroidota bacterium]|jgi:hypothetical protein
MRVMDVRISRISRIFTDFAFRYNLKIRENPVKIR